MPTLPLLAGDLCFLASSPSLLLWYLDLLLFTSTINIVSRVGNYCPWCNVTVLNNEWILKQKKRSTHISVSRFSNFWGWHVWGSHFEVFRCEDWLNQKHGDPVDDGRIVGLNYYIYSNKHIFHPQVTVIFLWGWKVHCKKVSRPLVTSSKYLVTNTWFLVASESQFQAPKGLSKQEMFGNQTSSNIV